MNDTWLEDFLALADCMNFSRAAERRHVTQPAFGRRIRALEDWCGQALVDRSSHRLALTEAGGLVLDAARDMLRRRDGLQRELGMLEAQASTLVVASTQALSFTFFPEWFSRASGGAAVHLLADNMRACERLMEEGKAHFLLCHTHPEMEFDFPRTHYRALDLATDRLVPVSKVSATGGTRFDPGGTNIPFLSFDERSGLGRILQTGLGKKLQHLDLKPCFTSHVAMALKTMMLEGRGLAWLPFGLVSEDIATGRCAIAGGPEWQLEVSISLMRPKTRLSPLAEAFWSGLAR